MLPVSGSVVNHFSSRDHRRCGLQDVDDFLAQRPRRIVAQQPIDLVGHDPAFVDLLQIDADPGPDDDLEQLEILKERNRASWHARPSARHGSRPVHVGANGGRRASPHAGIESTRERGEIDPFDAKARAALRWLGLHHKRAGTIRKREAQEVGFHRKPALAVKQRGIFIEARTEPARRKFAGNGRGAFMLACAHRQCRSLQPPSPTTRRPIGSSQSRAVAPPSSPCTALAWPGTR